MRSAAVSADRPTTAQTGGLSFQGALLVALILVVYLPCLSGSFLWDDGAMIFKNPAVTARDGLAKIWRGEGTPDYFPLTSSLFWTEWRLWGLDPRGYHAVNVLLHAAACLVLWLVLVRLHVRGAWVGALIFAVHPVCVESVAWIAEGKNTLSLLLYLTAILTWLRFEEHPSGRRYGVALAFFLLALFGKTSVVMLPAVLLLCAWWQRGRITRRDVVRCLPFVAMALGLGLVTMWFQYDRSMDGGAVPIPHGWARLTGAGRIVWFYLSKAVWPVRLMTVYPRFPVSGLLPDAGLAAAIALAFVMRAKPWGRALLFALGYYVLSLAPVLGFLKMSFMTFSPVADRFQYVALIGFAAFAGAAISLLPRKELSVVASIALLSALTIVQQRPYRSSEAMWARQLALTPDSTPAPDQYSMALLNAGKPAEAIAQIERALLLAPDDPHLENNWGYALERQGRFAESIGHFQIALAKGTNYAEAHCNLGSAFARLGRLDEAAGEFREALRIKPAHPDARIGLGEVLTKQGHVTEALQQFLEVLRLYPENAEAHDDLGYVMVAQGRWTDAIGQFQEALRIRPDFDSARHHLQLAAGNGARVNAGLPQ